MMASVYGATLLDFPPLLSGAVVGSFTNFVLDSTTDALQIVFQAPVSGPVLTKGAVRVGALTGASPVYRLSLQGVDMANDRADGTVKGGGSPVSVTFTPEAGDAGKIKEYTFANSYDSSPGEWLALVVDYSSGTCDGSNNWSFGRNSNLSTPGSPHAVTVDAGTPTRRQGAVFGVSDGSSWWGWDLWQSSMFETANTASLYCGNQFTLPAGMGDTVSCVGASFGSSYVASVPIRLSLYAADGTTLLASTDTPTNALTQVNGWVFWDDGPVTLTCGVAYRLVAAGVANSTRVTYLDVASTAHWSAFPWGNIGSWTQGTAGSWTETATRRALISPVISDITEPAGGGGLLRHPGMNGGING